MSAPRPLLAAALSAAGRGWPVFPVLPYAKRPAILDWPRRASCDPQQLARWWQAAPYNVGIACGPAGLLVVDFDRRAPDGDDVAWATYTVLTPRGEHRYFTVPAVDADVDEPAEVYRRRVRVSGRTTAGALGPGIDTRGAGGYVLAAGSVLRVDGRRHVYRAVGADMAQAPRWLLDALAPPLVKASGFELARPGAYVRAAVCSEAAGVRDAPVGTRNGRLFGAAVRLGQLSAAGLITETEVAAALSAASAGHVGVDGFTAAEVARAIGNGLSYGRRRPRVLDGHGQRPLAS